MSCILSACHQMPSLNTNVAVYRTVKQVSFSSFRIIAAVNSVVGSCYVLFDLSSQGTIWKTFWMKAVRVRAIIVHVLTQIVAATVIFLQVREVVVSPVCFKTRIFHVCTRVNTTFKFRYFRHFRFICRSSKFIQVSHFVHLLLYCSIEAKKSTEFNRPN